MATYATVADLRTYADITGGDDNDLERILERAERDIDNRVLGYIGAIPDAQPRKVVPAAVPVRDRTALKNATCAQAEYRIAMGEPFFVKAQHASVSGPQFSTSGKLPYIGPKVRQEFAGSGFGASRWGTTVR